MIIVMSTVLMVPVSLMKVKRQVKSFHSDYTDSQAWLSLNISRTNFYNV